jgi:galactokinase
MRAIIHGSTGGLADVEACVTAIDGGRSPLAGELRTFLLPGADVFVTRAPLTVPVFGETDAPPGALTLRWSLGAGVCVVLQRDPQRILLARRVVGRRGGRVNAMEMPFAFLEAGDGPVRPDVVRAWFARREHRTWLWPVVGTTLAVMRELGVRFGEGLRVLVWTPVPPGLGLGVTDATIVALLRAVYADANFVAGPPELIRLARQVQCGRADPRSTAARWAAAVAAPANAFVAQAAVPQANLAALPAPPGTTVTLLAFPPEPEAAAVHASRSTAAWLGYREIGDLAAGAAREALPRAGRNVARGLVAAGLDSEEFNRVYRSALPVEGEPAGGTGADRRLPCQVRDATALAVAEQARARTTVTAWQVLEEGERPMALGQLLVEAHEERRRAGWTAPVCDALVDAARGMPHETGVRGARQVPGANAVLVLASGADAAAMRARLGNGIRPAGVRPIVLDGSSPGAVPFGYVRLRGA